LKEKFKYSKYLYKDISITFNQFLLLHNLTLNTNSIQQTSFFNLLNTQIPSNIINIVTKGTKHIPTPSNINSQDVIKAIEDTIARLSWKIIYKDEQPRTETPDLLTYNPKLVYKDRPKYCHALKNYPYIKTIESRLQDAALELKQTYNNPNSYRTSIALKQYLIQNPDIKIVPADKNLGLVFLDIKQYNTMALDHLETDNYQLITTSRNYINSKQYHGTKSAFLKLIKSMQVEFKDNPATLKFIKTTLNRLGSKDFDLPNFHVIPKLHKKDTALQSRPIIGALNWFTTPISRILDSELKRVLGMPRVLENSFALLSQIKNAKTNAHSFLVSFDVCSLYTNINTNLLSDLLLKETGSIVLTAMTKFINKHNYFQYADLVYLQSFGIAMGTNAAPTLANFYLHKLVDSIINDHTSTQYYARYIDDLFLLWTGTLNELHVLHDLLNAVNPTLKFTIEYDKGSLNFLDVKLILQDNRIHFHTFQKALNKYAYITKSSCHPLATIKGFIKGELIRYSRLSSSKHYFNYSKELFRSRLLKRGYSNAFLGPIFDSIIDTNPFTATSKSDTNIPLILPYTKHPMMNYCIKKLKEISIGPTLPNQRFMITYSKKPNLIDLLCNSKITHNQISILKKANLLPVVQSTANYWRSNASKQDQSRIKAYSPSQNSAISGLGKSATTKPSKIVKKKASKTKTKPPATQAQPGDLRQTKITNFFSSLK
jgi:hypothetical protein